MLAITYIQGRYTGIDSSNNDEFSSASRSVKSGLIATGIVSAWTWAATLLQSSAVGTRVGISGEREQSSTFGKDLCLLIKFDIDFHIQERKKVD